MDIFFRNFTFDIIDYYNSNTEDVKSYLSKLTLTDILNHGITLNNENIIVNFFDTDNKNVATFDIYNNNLTIGEYNFLLKSKGDVSNYELIELMIADAKYNGKSIFYDLEFFLEKFNFKINNNYEFLIEFKNTSIPYFITYNGTLFNNQNWTLDNITRSRQFINQTNYFKLIDLKKVNYNFNSLTVKDILFGHNNIQTFVGSYKYNIKKNVLEYGSDLELKINLSPLDNEIKLTIEELILLNVDFTKLSFSDLKHYNIDLNNNYLDPITHQITNIDLKNTDFIKSNIPLMNSNITIDGVSLDNGTYNVQNTQFYGEQNITTDMTLFPIYDFLKYTGNDLDFLIQKLSHNVYFTNYYSYIFNNSNFLKDETDNTFESLGYFKKEKFGLKKQYLFISFNNEESTLYENNILGEKIYNEIYYSVKYNEYSKDISVYSSYDILNDANNRIYEDIQLNSSILNKKLDIKQLYIIELKPDSYPIDDLNTYKFTFQELNPTIFETQSIPNDNMFIFNITPNNFKFSINNVEGDLKSITIDKIILYSSYYQNPVYYLENWTINDIINYKDDNSTFQRDVNGDYLTYEYNSNSFSFKLKDLTQSPLFLDSILEIEKDNTHYSFDLDNKTIQFGENIYQILDERLNLKTLLDKNLIVIEDIENIYKYDLSEFSFSNEFEIQYVSENNDVVKITVNNTEPFLNVINSNINLSNNFNELIKNTKINFNSFFIKNNYIFTNGTIEFPINGENITINNNTINYINEEYYITNDLNILTNNTQYINININILNETSLVLKLLKNVSSYPSYNYDIKMLLNLDYSFIINENFNSVKINKDQEEVIINVDIPENTNINSITDNLSNDLFYKLTKLTKIFYIPVEEYQFSMTNNFILSLKNDYINILIDYSEKVLFQYVRYYINNLTDEHVNLISINPNIVDNITVNDTENGIETNISNEILYTNIVLTDYSPVSNTIIEGIVSTNFKNNIENSNFDDTIYIFSQLFNKINNTSHNIEIRGDLKNEFVKQYRNKINARTDISITEKDEINKKLNKTFNLLLPDVDGTTYVKDNDITGTYLMPTGKLIIYGTTINSTTKPLISDNGKIYSDKLDYTCEIVNNEVNTNKTLDIKIELFNIDSNIPIDVITVTNKLSINLSNINIAELIFFTGSIGASTTIDKQELIEDNVIIHKTFY